MKRLLAICIALTMVIALTACDDTTPGDDNSPTTTPPEQTESPASTPATDSDNPVNNAENDPDANRVLNSFGYADLWFDCVKDITGTEPDSIGWCHISFSVTGDTSNIAGVFVSSLQASSWTDAQLLQIADEMGPQWKQQIPMLSEWHFDGQHRDGFWIRAGDLGTTVHVLFFALDENADLIGHIQVPVAIPSDLP